MRKHIKYLFIVLSLLICVTPSFALNDTTLDNVIRLEGDGGKQGSSVRVLKLVRYDNNEEDGVSIVSGDALVYSLLSDDGVTVDRSAASADGAFAGIAAMTIQTSDRTSATSAYDDVGGRNWGWMVVHGPANATIASGSGPSDVAGFGFITSGDAATVGSIQTHSATGAMNGAAVNNSQAAVAARGGFFLDTAAVGDTSVEVFVENL